MEENVILILYIFDILYSNTAKLYKIQQSSKNHGKAMVTLRRLCNLRRTGF